MPGTVLSIGGSAVTKQIYSPALLVYMTSKTYKYICLYTPEYASTHLNVRWLMGPEPPPAPLCLLMHTFLYLDIKVTVDTVLCLNAMVDKGRIPRWQIQVASPRATGA